MAKRPRWGGWRKTYLLYGDAVLANVMLLQRGCVIVNEWGWGRKGLADQYSSTREAKKAVETWACKTGLPGLLRQGGSHYA